MSPVIVEMFTSFIYTIESIHLNGVVLYFDTAETVFEFLDTFPFNSPLFYCENFTDSEYTAIEEFIFFDFVDKTPSYNFFINNTANGFEFIKADNYFIVSNEIQLPLITDLVPLVDADVVETYIKANNVQPTNTIKKDEISACTFKRYYAQFGMYAPVFFGIIFFLVLAVVLLRQNNPASTMFNSKHTDGIDGRVESQKIAATNLKTNKLFFFVKKTFTRLFKNN
jgi:hypothetical protein